MLSKIEYTSSYCEENIYQLAEHVVKEKPPRLQAYVVFLSTPTKTMPIWEQSKSPFVIWDYHVVLLTRSLQCPEEGWFLWDPDTRLPIPCPLEQYLEQALCRDLEHPPEQPLIYGNLYCEMNRKYRVIEANTFVQHFSSDRSHMKTNTGEWLSPPPSYPCIGNQMNLSQYTNVNENQNDAVFGTVYSEGEFRQTFQASA
ncbi:protein N-terminal glutamine amidohydrolase, alpha beta roll superfamily [Schizosaccharomyces osmophilus]|uniref:Protein N-terminal glutamine amidohydrolase n=1 Tax=Schizosaccharomyces osmophilus TaxID=2545709 RepID=A0AAE9W9D4_9SCHI|nr:protein N-terminal glutamine amidohydrolase, alpha beta roll superfamily [Schizosaccharomyces osmophilus]WBW71773.1 protein N-terminal glutamine amidohydrolase, alpha beta roll superfamily [Schizosaccharomyces osmophilus]